MNNKAQMITIFFSLFLILAIITRKSNKFYASIQKGDRRRQSKKQKESRGVSEWKSLKNLQRDKEL